MKRALSILLIVVGVLFVVSALASCAVRASAGIEMETGVVLFLVALGAVAIWGGLRLWKR